MELKWNFLVLFGTEIGRKKPLGTFWEPFLAEKNCPTNAVGKAGGEKWGSNVPKPILPRFFIFLPSQMGALGRQQTCVSARIYRPWDGGTAVHFEAREVVEENELFCTFSGTNYEMR